MKDCTKHFITDLAPARDKVVRQLVNWLARVRDSKTCQSRGEVMGILYRHKKEYGYVDDNYWFVLHPHNTVKDLFVIANNILPKFYKNRRITAYILTADCRIGNKFKPFDITT